MVDKINAMPGDVKNMFDKKYPRLIDSVLPYITTNKITPSQCNMDEICEWWEY